MGKPTGFMERQRLSEAYEPAAWFTVSSSCCR